MEAPFIHGGEAKESGTYTLNLKDKKYAQARLVWLRG